MAETEPIDTTSSPRLEEERARAPRLKRLLDIAALGAWEVDFVTGTTERSERALFFLGLPPEDAHRLDAWRERLHARDRARVERTFERACDPLGDGRYAAEYRVVLPNGQVRWLNDRGWIEFEGEGTERRAARVVGVVSDITPRRRAQQRLAVEHEVSRVLARAEGFDDAIPDVLAAILRGMDAGFCAFWQPDPEGTRLSCVRLVRAEDEAGLEPFVEASRTRTFEPGRGLPGRAWASGKAVCIESLAEDPNFPRSPVAVACGLKSGVAMPVPGDGAFGLGVIEWFSREPLAHDADLLAMMEALGAEVGQFLLRARAEQARRDSERLHQALYEAGRLLADTLDAETIYERMRTIVSRTVQVDGLVVSSFDADDGLIRCEHAWADGRRLDPAGFPAVRFNPASGMQSESSPAARRASSTTSRRGRETRAARSTRWARAGRSSGSRARRKAARVARSWCRSCSAERSPASCR